MRVREAIPAGNPSHCSGAAPKPAKLKVLTLHFPLPESDSRGQGPARPRPTPPTPSTSYRARPRPHPSPFRAEILAHIPASLARVALSEAAPGLVSPSPTLPSPASTPRTSRLAPARSGPGVRPCPAPAPFPSRLHCDPRTSVNMALRAVRSVRAATRSLRVAAAPAAPCLPRPWGLRAGPVRTLRTGSALLSGKRGRARGESRAAWGDGAGLLPPGPLLTSSPQ